MDGQEDSRTFLSLIYRQLEAMAFFFEASYELIHPLLGGPEVACNLYLGRKFTAIPLQEGQKLLFPDRQ